MSGQGLREALDKLLEERGHYLTTFDVRRVLDEDRWGAAKPALVVTDEAVEAAAMAVSLDWEKYTASMRTALKAAAPLLGPRPLLDREAVRSLIGAASADLAAYPDRLDFVTDAVMELARPMPTEVEIAERVRRIFMEGGAARTHAQEAAAEIADAMVALLKGEADASE